MGLDHLGVETFPAILGEDLIVGLSTDTKPSLSTGGSDNGSKFYEYDTGKTFLWSGTGWVLFIFRVAHADTAQVDAFGRLKVGHPLNAFKNKNIHSKNDSLWEEYIVGAIIIYENLAVSTFEVGEVVIGQTSNTVGTVTAVDGGSLTITYTVNHNNFEDGEQIVGGTSNATADIISSNTGSNISHDRNTASVTLQVGSNDGDRAVRQSHRYIPYIPGDAQEVQLTFLFGVSATNVTKYCGLGDDDNALFLKETSSGLSFVVRSKTSGSAVDTEYARADWNIDSLDGTGTTKINLNFANIEFVYIDFTWQASGRVRFGFIIDGITIVAHEAKFSNKLTVPFISTPTLPVRYEIINTGVTSGTNTMKELCSSVVSNGGGKLTGRGYSKSLDVTPREVTVAAGKIPIMAIRLSEAHPNGGANRVTAEIKNFSAYILGANANLHFEIEHIHDPTGIVGGSWVAKGDGSAIEYNIGITAVVGNPAHGIEEGYLSSGDNKSGVERDVSVDKDDQHKFITQNFDSTNSEMFVLWGQAFIATASVYGHLSWLEFE